MVEILKIKDSKEKFAKLRASANKQAQFLWATFCDTFLYAAYHAGSIANTTRDIDLAMRWGFGWQQGIFETWQLADWQAIGQMISDDVQANKTMVNVALPQWVQALPQGPYNAEGAFAPTEKVFLGRSALAVYQRQLMPELMLGESHDQGETIFANDGLRLWTQNDDVLIASFKTKGNTINMAVLDGLLEGLRLAEQDYQGLVIWNPKGAEL